MFAKYDDAIEQIQDADILLLQRRSVIASVGRGVHSHAAMAAWWGPELMCLEMLQFRDGRAVTLRSQVERWPGRWDVFESNPEDRYCFDRSQAVRTMRQFAGTPYGWWNVARAGFLHLPVVRLLVPAETDDTANGTYPPFCSQAVSRAVRDGGVDPVPNLADRLTEPADLARSSFFRYRFTLIL